MSSGQEVGEIFGAGTGPAASLLRSPTVIIAAVGLWGMNVYLFKLFGIDYSHVLTLDLMKEKEANGKNGSDDSEKDIQNIGNDTCSVGSGGGGGGGQLHTRRSPIPPSTTSGSKLSHKNNNGVTNNNSNGGSSQLHDNMNTDGEVTSSKLIIFSLSLLLLLHVSTVLWIDMLGGSTIGAIFAFYTAVIIGIVIPLPSTIWIRTACVTVFHRAFELINPRCFCLQSGIPRAVPFIDVFFADAMCSLSKVFFDWGMLWHLAWHYPQPVPMDLHSIAIPSIAASLPYLCRARQCIIMHTIGRMKGDPKRYQHMLNAIKYSTSLWPLILSAYQKVVTTEEEKTTLENILIVLLAINSTYSLAWDIIMDWGMMQKVEIYSIVPQSCAPTINQQQQSQSCAHSVLRSRLRYGATASVAILLVDTVLRYSWMLRFWEKDLFPSTDVYILVTQFLEAIRRALWNLLRVEWENIKQTRGKEQVEKDVEMTEKDPFLMEPASMAMSPRSGNYKEGHLT